MEIYKSRPMNKKCTLRYLDTVISGFRGGGGGSNQAMVPPCNLSIEHTENCPLNLGILIILPIPLLQNPGSTPARMHILNFQSDQFVKQGQTL